MNVPKCLQRSKPFIFMVALAAVILEMISQGLYSFDIHTEGGAVFNTKTYMDEVKSNEVSHLRS